MVASRPPPPPHTSPPLTHAPHPVLPGPHLSAAVCVLCAGEILARVLFPRPSPPRLKPHRRGAGSGWCSLTHQYTTLTPHTTVQITLKSPRTKEETFLYPYHLNKVLHNSHTYTHYLFIIISVGHITNTFYILRHFIPLLSAYTWIRLAYI